MSDFILEIWRGRARSMPRCSGIEPYGTHWRVFGDRKGMLRKARKLRRRGFRVLVYPSNCGRSTNYRSLFFESYPRDRNGRYHCVYCGNKLYANQVTVDHIVPVAAVKRSKRLQNKFRYTGVNTMENLVPSCRACNLYKGAKTSPIWRIRARLGKWRGYFVIRGLLIFALACYAGYELYVNVLSEYIAKWFS